MASAKLLPAFIPLVSLDGLICDGFTSWAAARALRDGLVKSCPGSVVENGSPGFVN